jgi:hypothetical protein
MKNDGEPPSCLRQPIFLIGQDSRGNWVVEDKNGTRGGLFVDRAQALRYIRSENGNLPQAFVTVAGVLELDLTRSAVTAPQRSLGIDAQRERRVA